MDNKNNYFKVISFHLLFLIKSIHFSKIIVIMHAKRTLRNINYDEKEEIY
jgi:hypothetical protein